MPPLSGGPKKVFLKIPLRVADDRGEAACHRSSAPRANACTKHEEIARDLQGQQQRLGDAMEQALDQVIDDDVLRLIFTACHPVLAVEGRVALHQTA